MVRSGFTDGLCTVACGDVQCQVGFVDVAVRIGYMVIPASVLGLGFNNDGHKP